MKLKIFARMLLAALSILCASGCDKDETKIGDGPGPVAPVTFELKVAVDPGQATVSVKPSDKTAAYFYGAMVAAEFGKFATEEAFLTAETARIQTLAQDAGVTPAAYLKANGKLGDTNISVITVEPETAYYFYVYAVDPDGKVTSSVFKAEFTSGEAPLSAPELEALTLIPGDLQGLDKDIKMTGGAKSSGVVSGRVLIVETSVLTAALDKGTTLESLINNDKNGTPFEDQEIEALNSADGWKYPFIKLTPGTSYTLVVKITNAAGSTIESVEGSTLADAGSDGPSLDMTLTRGDAEGKNKTTCMTSVIKSSGAMGGMFILVTKSSFDTAIEQGLTLSQIIETSGSAFSQEQLNKINSTAGFQINIDALNPGVAYTAIAKVASAGGTTIKTATATTTTGIGPDVKVSLIPGDQQGKDKDVKMTVIVKSPGAVSGRYAMVAQSEVDPADKPGSRARLMAAKGVAFTKSELTWINAPSGSESVISSLTPDTAYEYLIEIEGENGITMTYFEGKTDPSRVVGSDLTFTFAVDQLTPTSALIDITPSNNIDSYYFDYMPTAQFNQYNDAHWISWLIGSTGIADFKLSKGPSGYTHSDFEILALAPATEYYVYVFGYNSATKTASTPMTKITLKTPAKNEPATDAYKAWLGSWTVTSTSSEYNKTSVSFDITITQKSINSIYEIVGWTATTSQLKRKITASPTSDGGLRIRNNQEIGYLSDGMLVYAGRYYNSSPSVRDYERVPAQTFTLLGAMNADKQTARVEGGKFTIEGVDGEQTVTGMDFFNNKFTGEWTYFAPGGIFDMAGHPVGPYTLTKKTSSAVVAHTPEAPQVQSPQVKERQKIMLAKHEYMKRAKTMAVASKTQAASMSTVLNNGKTPASSLQSGTWKAATLNLSDSNGKAFRSAAKTLVETK